MELRLDHLSVTLSGKRVLDDVSVAFAPGRITAILGGNGAGKSTLVKAAAALLPWSAGRVTLDGRDVTALDPRARARAIGYLPQDAAVHWNVVAADVVALGRLPHRSLFAAPAGTDMDAVLGAMEKTETLHFADRPVHELSGGERARVLLARVLAGAPEWLLADEPLASLDPAHQFDILALMGDVARQGRGVVIVLHDLLHAGRVADDVLVLKDGRVLAFGNSAEVLTSDVLRAAYDIEVAVSHDVNGRPVCLPIGRTPR